MDGILMNQIALGVFLILNIIVAYKATKGIPKTMEDYALANRSLGVTTLLFSLFATIVDAGYLGLHMAYSDGAIGLFYPFSFAIMAILMGYFVFPKLVYFRKEYTIADVMGNIYGSFAARVTTLIMVFSSVFMMMAQLKEFGRMGFFLHLSPTCVIVVLGLFITCYTAVGGVRSVAFTDVLQFLVFAIGLMAFGGLVIRSYGGFHVVWQAFPSESDKGKIFLTPIFASAFYLLASGLSGLLY